MTTVRLTLSAFMISMLALPLASAAELSFVESESKIDFVGKKADGKHEGGFNKFSVDATANPEEPAKSTINIEIEAKSLWSDDDKLTNHLKSPDFFDVRNHPKIVFESTEIEPGKVDDDYARATIKGDLTMLGKKVEIEVPVKAKVSENAIQLEAKFTIDRTKWGMTYGEGKIENDVTVKVEIAFQR